MSKKPFVYAKLIDQGFNHQDPLVLLELGMEMPVDWEAVDGQGDVICKLLEFVLIVERVKIADEPLGIRCVYDRIVRDYGIHEGLHVYRLGLRPVVEKCGRNSYQAALETVVKESAACGRNWCADISQVLISWQHVPDSVNCLNNGAYLPETSGTESSQPEGEADIQLGLETDPPEPEVEVDIQLDLETEPPQPEVEIDIGIELDTNARPESDFVDCGLDLELNLFA